MPNCTFGISTGAYRCTWLLLVLAVYTFYAVLMLLVIFCLCIVILRRTCFDMEIILVAGSFKNLTANAVDGRGKDCKGAFASHISASHLSPLDGLEPEAKGPAAHMKTQQLENKDLTGSGIAKTSRSDSISSLHIGNSLVDVAEDTEGKDGQNDSGPSKKMKTDGNISLNSMCSDTIEATILELEELVNRVKWIEDILEFEIRLPNSVRPSWKFLEHRASSLPK